MSIRRRAFALAGVGAALAVRSYGQTPFPLRPVSVVVGAAAGGPNDIVARVVSERLAQRLGVAVVVDNKPGASGFVAVGDVRNAAPDGYRLLFASTALFSINPWLFKTLPYDPVKDFASLSLVARIPQLLLVAPQLGCRNVAELIEWMRAHPTEATYGSAGVGTPLHIAAELFCQRAGVRAVHSPYKGSSPAYTDLLAGRIQFIFDGIPGALSYVRSGQLLALASTGTTRQALLPNVPTLAEAGLTDAEVESWFGFAAPAATPSPIRERLSSELQAVLKDAELRTKLEQLGALPWGTDANGMTAYVASDTARWQRLVASAGVKPE